MLSLLHIDEATNYQRTSNVMSRGSQGGVPMYSGLQATSYLALLLKGLGRLVHFIGERPLACYVSQRIH